MFQALSARIARGRGLPLMVLLSALVAPHIGAQKSEKSGKQNQEIEVPGLGVRLQRVLGARPNDSINAYKVPPREYLRVSAVRRNGAAFLWGIFPGDIINSVGSHDRSASGMEAILRAAKNGDRFFLGVEYQIEGTRRTFDKTIIVKAAEGLGTEWIIGQEKPSAYDSSGNRTFMRGAAEEMVRIKSAFESEQGRVEAEFSRLGCALPVDEIERTSKSLYSLGVVLDDGMSESLIKSRLLHLKTVSCANASGNALSDFATAVFAITTGRVDPCEYASGSRFPDIFAHQRSISSKQNYNENAFMLVRNYLENANGPVVATAAQRSCFRRIIEQELRR